MRTLWLSGLLVTGDAWAGSLFGGRLAESPQFYFNAGYPSTEIGFHLPIGDNFELTPWARFRFAWGTSIGSLWTGPGLDMRGHVFGKGDLSGALVFSFGTEFLINSRYYGYRPDDRYFRARLSLGHPGMMVSWAVTEELDLDFGLRVQPYLVVGDVLDFSVSIPTYFGVTFEVGGGVEIGFLGHGGPLIDGRGVFDADVGGLFFMGFAL